MNQPKRILKARRALPDTTLRRLRNTPSYFFLIWRWSWWIYALVVIIFMLSHPHSFPYYQDPTHAFKPTALFLLSVTLLQTLAVTLYAPIFQIFLPRLPWLNRLLLIVKRSKKRRHYSPGENDEPDSLTPLVRTRNPYWELVIYGTDVLICGLVMYYGGPFGSPPFGNGSPFYRYGISAVFASALAYRYRGGLAAAIGYDLFALLGMIFPAPGTYPHSLNIVDVGGSLMDAPIVALLAAYLSTLIANYAQSKKREQANARQQKTLVGVGETILREVTDRERLLQKAAEQLRHGGHFERLVMALIGNTNDEENEHNTPRSIIACIEVEIPQTLLLARNTAYLEQVIRSEQKLVSFESIGREGIARLYLPFFREGHVQMVIGVESRRHTPFDSKQEDFLAIAGRQLLVALDNIRLTEQMIQLAATTERGRIAREIHDGIAQLTYMLSLNAETCATQAHRIAEASEEDTELITPLAQRLDKLVTISKQALWETRNYMFSLKPLMSGTTTLTQMLTNQLREFETISDLPVQLEIKGAEDLPNGDHRRTRKYAQVGAAIFRIVQEALTNAYKYANATQLHVQLSYLANYIEVNICDNGRGLPLAYQSNAAAFDDEDQRIYSGHGLRGMRERAEELDGTFEIAQVPTGGVKVQARIPI